MPAKMQLMGSQVNEISSAIAGRGAVDRSKSAAERAAADARKRVPNGRATTSLLSRDGNASSSVAGADTTGRAESVGDESQP